MQDGTVTPRENALMYARHVDNLAQQGRLGECESLAVPFALRRLGEHVLTSATSVSYTHLDVYKRQSPNRPARSSVDTRANTSPSRTGPPPSPASSTSAPVKLRSPDPTRRTVSPNQLIASNEDNPATGSGVTVSLAVIANCLEQATDQASAGARLCSILSTEQPSARSEHRRPPGRFDLH